MAYTSEIEKLEKRWAENPKGRNFAPLADAYRKAGELDRAIELCTAGLALHPDYVSAHIVYARCLMDQKNDPGAADVFRKVLTLDPENVLALKILAEIAERGGCYDEAVTWLTRLLGADPMNGEAAEHLSRAKTKAAGQGGASAAPAAAASVAASSQTAALAAGATRARPPLAATAPSPRVALGAATTPSAQKTAEPATLRTPDRAAPRAPGPRAPSPPSPPSPPPPPPPPPHPASPAKTLGLVVEHVSESPGPPSAPRADKRASAGIETFDGTINFDAVAHEAAKADGLEVQEEVELKPQDLVVEGLAPTQFDSIAPAPDHAPAKAAGNPRAPAHEELLELLAPDSDSGPTVDLPLIMPDDEETVAAAPPAPPPPAPAPRRTPASTPPRPSPPPPPPPAPPPPAAVALSDDDGAADTETLSRAEPVVTETLAELYLRQGHADDALRVYQALLAQRPGDTRLQARVAGLSGGGASAAAGALGGTAGESVEAFLRRILAGRPRLEGAEAPLALPIDDVPALPEPETQPPGSALDGAFAIAPMEPEPRPDVHAPGEATRPAADTISLDAVFGDEARSSLPSLPRAAPPASATPAGAEETPPSPSEAPASSASGPSTTGGFSFDQFFSPNVARGEGGAPAGESPSGGGGGSPQRTSGAKPRAPAEDEADLDQFQAWLRGLKS